MRTGDELIENVRQAMCLRTEHERILHLYWISLEVYDDAKRLKQPWAMAVAAKIVRESVEQHPWLADA